MPKEFDNVIVGSPDYQDFDKQERKILEPIFDFLTWWYFFGEVTLFLAKWRFEINCELSPFFLGFFLPRLTTRGSLWLFTESQWVTVSRIFLLQALHGAVMTRCRKTANRATSAFIKFKKFELLIWAYLNFTPNVTLNLRVCLKIFHITWQHEMSLLKNSELDCKQFKILYICKKYKPKNI